MKLAEVFALVAGPATDVEFVAYDGSRAGTPGGSVRLELKSPRGVSLMLSSPGQLGLARAYVAGELDVDGDMYTALSQLADLGMGHLTARDKVHLAKALAPYATYRREPPPPEEVRLHGRRHAKNRDGDAIHHHYDVSNQFYEWVLGPSMAYTCAVFPTSDTSLEQAQQEKVDLVCRKLGLKAGDRLLDVGCGWGTMVLHAVKNYGVTAIGVTLSRQQAEFAQQQISDAGLEGQAQVRFQDYRDVPEAGFDAISSIGLTEHIGASNYPAYFSFLRSRLLPEGRLLNHCITRTDTRQKTQYRKGFINRYVFPDGELVPIGQIIDVMEDEHLEVRHEENLREHYAMTLRDWLVNLDDNWDDAVQEVGRGKARVWRLYMAASRLGFERNWIQLHQVLATRTDDRGSAGVPLRPWF
ncbi:MAG TPA: cyclopropane-fatty-acyl-phospholipid synthase family protein [Pedococcus sp.]|jgi:cyclopropane-fatty-acyl-phospholipid synthase|nr:cyclopropane-fatty-acyl-phospholipid synthase family protein [Pedococcus sp.]